MTINTAGFNITWTGNPWSLGNANSELILSGPSGSITVVKGSVGPGEILFGAFNALGSTNAALPIELSAMIVSVLHNAKSPQGASVAVHFTTTTERDNAGFVIERSADGRNFDAIGNIAGAGNSDGVKHYTFIDENPLKGIGYYRLKQMDFDGQFSYSPLHAAFVGGVNEVLLSPSPGNGLMQAQLGQALDADTAWQIVDMTGRVALSGQAASETLTFSIDATALPTGRYTLRMADGTRVVAKQFVKQ